MSGYFGDIIQFFFSFLKINWNNFYLYITFNCGILLKNKLNIEKYKEDLLNFLVFDKIDLYIVFLMGKISRNIKRSWTIYFIISYSCYVYLKKTDAIAYGYIPKKNKF